jgi:hypothetical protein
MAQHGSTLIALAIFLVGILACTDGGNADDSIQAEQDARLNVRLNDQIRNGINGWIVELDDDDFRVRAIAHQKLEKLTGSELVYARQQLTEKLSLEYMIRRERILKTYALTNRLERVANEIREYRKTGESEVLGLAAYCRMVDTNSAAVRTFYELERECQNYLVTVYAAPGYAQAAVQSEIKTVIKSGNRSDWQTDTMALKWISIFLTLCDNDVKLDDRRISSELRILTSNLQILSIEFAMQDRQHGLILRELIKKFVSEAGERDSDFAQTHRALLAVKLKLTP